MTTFFPGPSELNPLVPQFLQDAVNSGILSASHRSKAFDNLSEATLKLLHEKLNIPQDYRIFYTSSATECWEIVSQSIVLSASLHLYSGSFGQKWFEYAKKLKAESKGISFDVNDSIDWEKEDFEQEILCLTQNETSNGTQVNSAEILKIRARFPDKLIAYDVTSSINGIDLPFDAADIWFASVQKCFGLPAGLGLLICSPKAMEAAKAINERKHYNSLLVLDDHIQKFQTSCTPNVLGIYLLNRVLESQSADFNSKIGTRATALYKLLDSSTSIISPLVTNQLVRSETVIAVYCSEEHLVKVKDSAKQEGFLLGNGYGKWSSNTFRIANFPAISDHSWEKLISFLGAL
jgi:phosphoserine aminotransferase